MPAPLRSSPLPGAQLVISADTLPIAPQPQPHAAAPLARQVQQPRLRPPGDARMSKNLRQQFHDRQAAGVAGQADLTEVADHASHPAAPPDDKLKLEREANDLLAAFESMAQAMEKNHAAAIQAI